MNQNSSIVERGVVLMITVAVILAPIAGILPIRISPVQPASAATADFTTWTEKDPNGKATVTNATHVEFSGMAKGAVARVYTKEDISSNEKVTMNYSMVLTSQSDFAGFHVGLSTGTSAVKDGNTQAGMSVVGSGDISTHYSSGTGRQKNTETTSVTFGSRYYFTPRYTILSLVQSPQKYTQILGGQTLLIQFRKMSRSLIMITSCSPE